MSNWNKVFKPIVVLCVICVVITGALAATNSVTAPIIMEATLEAQRLARMELLPEAEDFTRVDSVEVENVSDVYAASNGVGYVITSTAKGYGGTMTVMTSFTPEGQIKQVKVTEAAETQGIGSNVSDSAAYWAAYAGLDGTRNLVLNQDVDAYTGATISSRALNSAVNAAINAYNAIP
ncbi:FMN-binding protein [Oscillospiraceae bacterium 50-16]|nr:FMN-binding protein [Lawsonibacter sp.]